MGFPYYYYYHYYYDYTYAAIFRILNLSTLCEIKNEMDLSLKKQKKTSAFVYIFS